MLYLDLKVAKVILHKQINLFSENKLYAYLDWHWQWV